MWYVQGPESDGEGCLVTASDLCLSEHNLFSSGGAEYDDEQDSLCLKPLSSCSLHLPSQPLSIQKRCVCVCWICSGPLQLPPAPSAGGPIPAMPLDAGETNDQAHGNPLENGSGLAGLKMHL